MPQMILLRGLWIRKLSRSLPSDVWTLLFFFFLALALTALLVFLLGRSRGWRKSGFYSAVLCALLAALSLSFAGGQRAASLRQDEAIIIRPVVPVRSAPGAEGAKDLFILHEGTKVRVIDRVSEWDNIVLTDGRQGWISASDADLI